MPPTNPPPADAGRYAFDGLERVLHEKARLGILTSLLSHRDGLVFNELKELCSLTDGNLSRHLSTLQEDGLVEIWKGMNGRRPQTLVRLTAAGRTRFVEYLGLLESIVNGALATAEADPAPQRKGVGLNPV
jgi:DNA-binding MarR family transcriptional regulator